MRSEALFFKYRALLIKSYAWIALSVMVIEIITYFLVKSSHIQLRFLRSYFLVYVVIPSLINFGAVFVANLINKRKTLSIKAKNSATIFIMEVMAFNVSFFHGYFPTSFCSLCIPVLVSSIYGDKKIMRNAVVVSVLGLIISVMTGNLFEPNIDGFLIVNAIIALMMIMISYAIGMLSTKFEHENIKEMEHHILRQNKLEQQLQRDQMTGLFNQTAFYSFLHKIIYTSGGGKPITLAVIDLDDFKRINDTYGHERGNDVLRTLARIMEKHCSTEDIICRYGGEEFAVIYNGIKANEAKIVMEKILNEFKSIKFEGIDEVMSFSCGLCEYKTGYTYHEFFNRADSAMYEAKKCGKSRCVEVA